MRFIHFGGNLELGRHGDIWGKSKVVIKLVNRFIGLVLISKICRIQYCPCARGGLQFHYLIIYTCVQRIGFFHFNNTYSVVAHVFFGMFSGTARYISPEFYVFQSVTVGRNLVIISPLAKLG